MLFIKCRINKTQITCLDIIINPKKCIELFSNWNSMGNIKFIIFQPGAESKELDEWCQNKGLD